MEIETKKINEILLITPHSKRIDAAVSTTFKGQIVDLINRGNYFLILNLTEVEFLDSSGLGAIISIFKSVSENGSLILFGLQKQLTNLVKLTRMDKVFKITETEEQALKEVTVAIQKKSTT